MRKYLFTLTALLFILTRGFGQAWIEINSPTKKGISSCFFVNKDTGWIITKTGQPITGNAIYKTINGGTSWISQDFPPEPPNNTRLFNSIHFINSRVGIISCGNFLYSGGNPALLSSILWTNDGGGTWIYKDVGSEKVTYSIDARLVSPTTAYSIGQYGEAKKTTNGGASWTSVNYTGPYTGERLFPINTDTVYFAGLDNIFFLGGAFGKTVNGGVTWNTSIVSNNLSMKAIFFIDYFRGWIGGFGGVIKHTNNGGVSWTSCNTGVTSVIEDLVFTDALKGWAVTADGKIIHSTDGGLNWNIEYNGTIWLKAISFTKPNNIGYAVGGNGRILKYFPNAAIGNGSNAFAISIFPNPFSASATLLTSTILNNATLSVYNSIGQQVKQIRNISGQSFILPRDNLSIGVYFIQLEQDNKILAMEKLVIAGN